MLSVTYNMITSIAGATSTPTEVFICEYIILVYILSLLPVLSWELRTPAKKKYSSVDKEV